MPDKGTFVTGRWRKPSGQEFYVWTSSDTSSPWHGITAVEGELDPEKTNAKTYVAKFGDDHEFSFKDGSRCTWKARTEKASMFENLNTDPEAFAVYYRENVLRKDMFAVMSAALKKADRPLEYHMCISPFCHFIRYQETGKVTSMRKCDACGAMASVYCKAGDKIPDAALMALSFKSMQDLIARKELNDFAWDIGAGDKKVWFGAYDSWPTLYISPKISQLSVRGEHFIRGRVNREVLGEVGVAVYEDETIRLGISSMSSETSSVLSRMLSDPLIMLDMKRAEKFRDQYVDSRWKDEYTKFVLALKKKKLLTVDSAGLNETLTALYHMTQKKVSKKTIIKRDGKIIFPTEEVLENLNPFMFERAFNATEHGSYDSAGAVFNMNA